MKRRLFFALIIVIILGVMAHEVFAVSPVSESLNYLFYVNPFYLTSYTLSVTTPVPVPPTSLAQISTRARGTSTFDQATPLPQPPNYPFWLNLYSLSSQPEPPDRYLRSSAGF